MPNAQELIAVAASQIGTSGTDNRYNTWIWGHPCYDPDKYPWCAAFVSWCASQAGGLGFNPSASASGVFSQLQRIADADVQPGDFVCFNWGGGSSTVFMDHIGIVEWFDHDSGYFGTIEGNTLTDDGVVARMTRNNNASYFTCFCRPVYDGQAEYVPSTPVPEQTPSGAIHIHLQAMSQAGGILPEVVDNEDNAGDGSPIQLLAAWADNATLDAQADDLPKLSNPSDIGDAENGAVGNGISFTKLRLYLWSPNSDTCVMYRVKAAGQRFSWMVDDYDTGGSGDDFAGDGVNPITNVEAYAVPA